MVKNIIAAAVVAAGLGTASAAQAGTILLSSGLNVVSVTANSAAGATTSPFTLGNFGNAGTPGLVSTSNISIDNGTIAFTPNNSTPQAGVYSGTTPGVARSPFEGTNLAAGNYLVAEPNDPVTISFGSSRNNFNLLWGSVDGFNSLELDFRMLGISIGSLTVNGSQVASAVNQGTGGSAFQANGTTSAFVSLASLPGFDTVVLRSTQSAFEFDPSVRVPEPASMALLGMGLAGIGLIRRKKANAVA